MRDSHLNETANKMLILSFYLATLEILRNKVNTGNKPENSVNRMENLVVGCDKGRAHAG